MPTVRCGAVASLLRYRLLRSSAAPGFWLRDATLPSSGSPQLFLDNPHAPTVGVRLPHAHFPVATRTGLHTGLHLTLVATRYHTYALRTLPSHARTFAFVGYQDTPVPHAVPHLRTHTFYTPLRLRNTQRSHDHVYAVGCVLYLQLPRPDAIAVLARGCCLPAVACLAVTRYPVGLRLPFGYAVDCL